MQRLFTCIKLLFLMQKKCTFKVNLGYIRQEKHEHFQKHEFRRTCMWMTSSETNQNKVKFSKEGFRERPQGSWMEQSDLWHRSQWITCLNWLCESCILAIWRIHSSKVLIQKEGEKRYSSTSCVTLHKLHNLSEMQFSPPWSQANNSAWTQLSNASFVMQVVI